MSKRDRKPVQRLALAASLGLLGVSVIGTSASAAEPVTQTSCSDYTNSKVWQTRTQWARVSERVCLEWTTTKVNGAWKVRGRWEFRVDWPSDCTLSVGLPPSGGISCPAGRALKNPSLAFKNVIIDGGWKEGAGATRTGRCQFQNRYASRMNRSAYVQGCSGPWMVGRKGSSFVISMSAQGDVADDGDGEKFLGDWISQPWTWD
ncbi:hypothetical protein [Streptomyces sp. NPDC047061]|uniref:hypothetical protein n=1 Tax=Streptomyces sp. NPDC047061 TaxID=3154605 RepID=UPI0033EAC9FE